MSTSTITTQGIGSNTTTAAQAGNNFGSALTALLDTGRAMARRLTLIYDIYSERRQMQNLSDDVLKDLGITRAQLNKECSRSLVDVPANRK